MELTIKGGNQLKAIIDVDSLSLVQEDRSQVDLQGRIGWLNASLSGHARLEAEMAEIKDVVLNVREYSNVRLPKIDNLKSEVEENSKVIVAGQEEQRME